MNKCFLTVGAAALLLLASCSDSEAPETTPAPIEIEMTAVQTAAVNSTSDFGIELFKHMCAAKPQDNVVMSPLSASIGMGMLANSISGESQQTLINALLPDGCASALEALNAIDRRRLDVLPVTDAKTCVRLANSLWVQSGLSTIDNGVNLLGSVYSAEVAHVEFGSQSGIDRINGWVNEKTGGKITKIFDGPSPDVSASLINALYFKSEWNQKFDRKNTARKTFSGLTCSSQVDMMRKEGEFETGSSDKIRMLKDDFGNKAYSIFYILPVRDMVDVMDALTLDEIARVQSTLMGGGKVELSVPKFKFMDMTDLRESLTSMGLDCLFSGDACIDRVVVESLPVMEVKQTVSFEIDEAGAEGASATQVNTGYGSSIGSGKVEFTLDRPFIFFIQENSTGSILLMGRINNL